MHEDTIADQIDLMLVSIELIENRFSRMRLPEDFVSFSDGVTLLDAVSMRLQVIGESVRKIQKLEPSFLDRYPTIEWDKLARFRDLVSHHYTHVDHEIVYGVDGSGWFRVGSGSDQDNHLNLSKRIIK